MTRVLVVDDEQSIRITLEANLELAGFAVTTADSAENALSLLREQKFDLVLTDVRMPGMNGVELFRAVRALDPRIPVILMTAFAVESLIVEAINEGAFTVVSKPFDVGAITTILLRAVQNPVVLVVDGVGEDGAQIANALDRIGLRARVVVDEAQAVSAIADAATDVCVIDLGVAADGEPPLIDRLRRVDPALAFIALAADEVPELVRKVSASGAVGWLRKPVEPSALASSISSVRGAPARKK